MKRYLPLSVASQLIKIRKNDSNNCSIFIINFLVIIAKMKFNRQRALITTAEVDLKKKVSVFSIVLILWSRRDD